MLKKSNIFNLIISFAIISIYTTYYEIFEMSFFFATNQLKDSDDKSQQLSSSSSSTATNNNNDDNDKNIQEALKAISLDEKIDALKQDILNEIKKQEIAINSSIIKQLKENKDHDNDYTYDFFSFVFSLPILLFATIWKFIGIIPYLGPLLQLFIIINFICFIFSLLPREASSILIHIIKYISFKLIPILFSPLINACNAIAFDSAFIEIRHLIAYIISQLKDLMLSDMFQGVYNTKILSSFNISSLNISSVSSASVSEVLGDGSLTSLSDTYSYLKDSFNKLF